MALGFPPADWPCPRQLLPSGFPLPRCGICTRGSEYVADVFSIDNTLSVIVLVSEVFSIDDNQSRIEGGGTKRLAHNQGDNNIIGHSDSPPCLLHFVYLMLSKHGVAHATGCIKDSCCSSIFRPHVTSELASIHSTLGLSPWAPLRFRLLNLWLLNGPMRMV